MNSLVSGDNIDGADFLARIDLLGRGYTVMISDYLRFFRLRAYLRRYTQKPIGIVMSVRDLEALFDEKYYEGLEGGILEAFGKLFPTTPTSMSILAPPWRERNDHARQRARPRALCGICSPFSRERQAGGDRPQDADHLGIDAAETLAALRRGPGAWGEGCPP